MGLRPRRRPRSASRPVFRVGPGLNAAAFGHGMANVNANASESLSRRVPMRLLTTVALMLNLGIASLYAQHPAEEHSGGRRVRMKFSGSIVSSTLDLAPGTLNHEEHLAGNSTLGPFTYRGLWADDPATRTDGNCGSGFGPNFQLVAGGGVFRFQDGSLLTVRLTEGVLCI